MENVLSYKEIDALIRNIYFTMGTFEFLDHVGLDVILSSAKNYLEDMEHKEFISITIEEVQKFVDRGHLGVKTGRGFYSYNKEKGEEEPVNRKRISGGRGKKYEEEVVNKIDPVYTYILLMILSVRGTVRSREIEAALKRVQGNGKGPGHTGQRNRVWQGL